MAVYDQQFARGSATTFGDPLIPDLVTNQIVESAPEASVLLSRARRITLTNKTGRQPVLATLPNAYWVNGDTGMKQTSIATWENTFITAEELAVLVPIPDAYLADVEIPLWSAITPLVAEAMGKAVDQAGLFGINKPSSWPAAMVPGAIAAGNTVVHGTGKDLGQEVATLGQKMAREGFAVNGFASEPGLQWQMIGLRDTNGNNLFQGPNSGFTQGVGSTFLGFPFNEVMNGAWDYTAAKMIVADWSKVVIGIRQDMTYSMFPGGIISNDSGVVLLNGMQQDTSIMRVVFRVGFTVANPLTRVHTSKTGRYPAGVITQGLSD